MEEMEIISSILQTILLAILPVAAGAAARWLWQKGQAELQSMDKEQLAVLMWLADLAVKAAEQAKLSGYIDDKKAFALDFCERWLSDRGISANIDALNAAIEAAVFENFNASTKISKKK